MNCKICEKPSGIYPLCAACFKLRDAGKVSKCEECGEWHYTNKPCKCTKTAPKAVVKEPPKEISASELTCIVCGENSSGKHFCISCYHKYKDKSIDLRITNCKDIQVLDEYGNLTIECDDGRKVRSRAEALISNFLYNNKIRSVYEKTVFYKEDGQDKTLHPDFYLPDYDVYIEYNEIKKKSYLKSKEYTQSIYDKLGFKVIIMDDKDLNSIAGCLKPKLGIN